jgi:type II secretory pathway pseudopilin PulG
MKKLIKKLNIFSQKGTTIVELMLYMTILSVLLVILTNVFTSALDVQSESVASSSVEEDGNYILARMDYDVHRAQSINVPTANGQTANYFQIAIGGVNYSYGLDGNNNLVLTSNLVANNLNNYGTSISNLSVQRLGNTGGVEDTLKISFTVTSRTKRISGYETKNFDTTLSLRRQ